MLYTFFSELLKNVKQMDLEIRKILSLTVLLSSISLSLISCRTVAPYSHKSVENVAYNPTSKEETKRVIKSPIVINKNCLERCPTGTSADNILVDHDAIILSSNKITKFADWVAYHSKVSFMKGPKRNRNWTKDPEINDQSTFKPADYKGMSQKPYLYDRGHQAPLASFTNHPKWYVVNYLSNITPQKSSLNRGPWKNLESAERELLMQEGEAYVLTGPYYDKKEVIEGPDISRIKYLIPSGYWRIIAVRRGNKI